MSGNEAEKARPEGGRHEDTVNRGALIMALLPLVFSLLLAGGLFYYFQVFEERQITVRIAADQPGSDIHDLLEAVATLARQQDDDLEIELVATTDPAHNIKLLESGEVDFAAIPTDAVTRPSFALVANLYPDTYHMIVRADSGITSIHDLEGKPLAVPFYKTSAYRSFWFMIGHYGLNPERMRPFPMSRKKAILALRKGEVDGLFLMLPPGDRHIRWLAETSHIRILPLNQAEAMTRRRPALRVVSIPAGLYAGIPPLPKSDMKSVAANRMLVTREDVDSEIVRVITSVLFENRRDLSIYSKLAALISRPDMEKGTILPVHEGALAYYDRDQPSFLQENAEVIGVLFSIAAVMFSGLMWLRRRWLERQKGRADVYNLDLVDIGQAARKAGSMEELAELRRRLYSMLEQVVHDLDEDRIDGEGFQYFSFTWEAALRSIKEAEERLGGGCSAPVNGEMPRP